MPQFTVPKRKDISPIMHEQYPMTRNLKINPKLLGTEPLLVPMADHVSSQRLNMLSNNLPQTLVTDGAEYPTVATGYEMEFGKYRFDGTKFEQDSIILATIPRYRTGVGAAPIQYCPSYTIIYLGLTDNKVHCMYVNKYTQGSNGFGYDLNINKNLMQPQTKVYKDQSVSHSNNVNGVEYNLGVNANVCYMTAKETVEDAICVSKSLADKLITTGFRTIPIDIDRNMVPLNIYGDDDIYKFIPELGEPIRNDGIVCAFRNVNPMSYIADMTDSALKTIYHTHDKVFFMTHPDATLVGIEVFKNDTKKVKTPAHVFEQLNKYTDEDEVYWKSVITVYENECRKQHKEAAAEFNNLVKVCARKLFTLNKTRVFNMSRKSPTKFSYKNEAIPFIRLNLIIRYKSHISLGSKICGRFGDKGVLSKILPDTDFPIDDLGVRADMIAAPAPIFNRMNSPQFYEIFISLVARIVLNQIKALDCSDKAWAILMDFLNDMNPEYAVAVYTGVLNAAKDSKISVDAARKSFMTELLGMKTIPVIVPPSLDRINTEWVLYILEKYNVEKYVTPVEYNLKDRDGNLIRRVRTRRSIYIGHKYVFLLCKVPYCKSSGMGHINQWQTPVTVKNTAIKNQSPVALTAIRLGEDEVRCCTISIGPSITSRILCLYANSPESTEKLALQLLTDVCPSKLSWVDESTLDMRKKSKTIQILNSISTTVGIDIRNPIASEDEMTFLDDCNREDDAADVMLYGDDDADGIIDDDAVEEDD